MEPTSLNAERWRRIESIFHVAIERAPQERAEFVIASCGGDELLLAEVQQILAGFEAEQKFTRRVSPRSEISRTGAALGEYRIEREIAHGGMGTVYLAHRADGQFSQQVAIKVVSAHLRNEFFAERFLTERQILAQLNHPNITRLLDGGVSAEGEPYLVMEYVDGEPLNRYCDARLLAIEDRIGLFLQVCSAVEYAHRNLVVHRDLKHGNILVTAEGVPKLLDFGTAKLLSLAAPDSTTTKFGMMTPRYASPEQLRGEPVTTVADVFSLGVVLYELLTGAWPFGDPNSPVAGLERAVRRIEPTRPSAVITEETARLRAETRPKLSRMLDGDLRSILDKACEPNPQDRYRSVEQFSEDLRRYVSGQPVLARPQTALYRAARFAQRNRWRLAAGGCICAVLGMLAFLALQQYGRNQRRMIQVRNLSQSYLTDILNEVGKLPGSINARMLIVDRARMNLDELLPEAPGDPALRRAVATAYLQLGNIQGQPFAVSIGDTPGALLSYREAEALAANGGPKAWELMAVLVRARINIGVIEARAGNYAEAVRVLESTIEPARRLWKEAPRDLNVDGNSPATLAVDANLRLGYAMMRASSAAPTVENLQRNVAQFRRTIALAEEIQTTYKGPRDLAAVPSQYLGFALEGLAGVTGDPRYYRDAAEAHRRALPGICKLAEIEPSPTTLRNCADGYGEYSWALRNSGDGEAAIQAARECLARMQPIAQAEPNSAEAQEDIADGHFHLGAAEAVAGRFQDSIRDLRIAEAMIRPRQAPPRVLPESAKLYVNIQRILAKTFMEMHDPAAAMKAVQNGLSAAASHAEVGAEERKDLEQIRDTIRSQAR